MSNLTDLLPAGAGGKQVDFVASGAISSGVTVGLNSDGTVEAVVGVTQGTGSEATWSSSSVYSAGYNGVSAVYHPVENVVVVVYADEASPYYGRAVVGSISGNTITFGSAVVFNSNQTRYPRVTYDSSTEKVVVVWQDLPVSTGHGTAVVGTVSGTSISFGSVTIFNPAGVTEDIAVTFDSNSNKVVVVFKSAQQSNRGYACVGTVSGTSISFGSTVIFASGATLFIGCCFDTNQNKVVICYRNFSNSSYGTAIVGTVSGTSISFGTAVVYESAQSNYNSIVYDSTEQQVVVVYQDAGNSNYATAVVGTVSGTSVSFGSATVIRSAPITYINLSYNSQDKKINVFSLVGVLPLTLSNGSLSVGTLSVPASTIQGIDIAYDSSANKSALIYANNVKQGKAKVFTNASTNYTDFIGISDAAISDTASGSVTIKGGISTNVTGLTPNATYYVQTDGSLSTTASDVLAGKALSSTSINLDYTS